MTAPLPLEERERILARQVRRDRARLAEAAAELAALRRRLPWLWPEQLARCLIRLAPEARRGRLLRGLERLARRPPGRKAPPAFPQGPGPAARTALLIDAAWPRPDRDSGSMDVLNMIEALVALDIRVLVAASRQFGAPSPDIALLQARGAHCLGLADALSVREFITRNGHGLDLVVLNRVYGGGPFLEDVATYAPQARIVFNPVDLNYLRMEREARLLGGPKAGPDAAAAKAREMQVIAAADATIVVSSLERQVLAAEQPQAFVAQMPLARPVRTVAAPLATRAGIGFIGSFAHAPNVDALAFFLARIWPLILAENPALTFSIVGADLPPQVLESAPGKVDYLGHVADVGPWFDSLRLTVAPLRYGAGAKGKVASSLSHGTPCVMTAAAAEGMGLQPGVNALVADDPAAFAAHVNAVCTAPALWSRLSAAGLAFAQAELSIPGWRRKLAEMLDLLGLSPG